MTYAETLSMNDMAYVWNGDVRYSEKVTRIDGRYIYTDRFGRFGRKTGKGIDEDHLHLADVVGERVVQSH